MDWRQYVRQQLSDVTGDRARDEEIVEELAQHLAARVDELSAAGMAEDRATAQAAAELRSGAPLAAALRRADRQRPAAPVPPARTAGRLFADLRADIAYALRLLRRTPAFTAAAILTLALGTGMTTAIASVVQAVLLRPVPLPEPERLVMMWETDRQAGTTREPASLPDFVDYRQRSRQVDRLGAFLSFDMDLLPDQGEPRRLSVLRASAELVSLLGIRTIAGRPFDAREDTFGAAPVVMISNRLWEQAFARDAAAIGATIRLDGVRRTIVGVAAADADFGILQMLSAAAYARGFADRDQRARVDVWLPLQPDPADTAHGNNHAFIMVGRLAAGASVAAAQDEMAAIAADLERAFPDNAGRGAFVERLDDVVLGRTRIALSVLTAAVALVLLIACANVASLLLARGAARRREIAVRAALGAEALRLARQFVVENVVLAVGAAMVGVPLAFAVLKALTIVGPASIPRLSTVSLDWRVLLGALLSAAVVGLVFGMLPLAQARRVSLQQELRAGEDRTATDGREGATLRSVLVVAEVALAVVLVAGAGLLIHSFWNLTRTNPGFDAHGVLKAQFQLSPGRFPRARDPQYAPAYQQFMTRVLNEVTAIPGVNSAGLASFHPLDTGFTQSFQVVGREAEAEHWPELTVRHVTPGYFRTLRVPLVRGRLLVETDASESPAVIVINETTATRFFPNQDPLGQKISFWGVPRTIVGIAGDERFHGVARPAPVAAYVPLTQMTWLALIVRADVDPGAVAPPVRAAIRRIAPEMAVYGIEPLEETLSNTLAEQRFMMLLLGLFAALAVGLAAVGVHGVLACLVAQRTREIGVRMALGATAGRVMQLVVSRGLSLVALGVAIGLVLTLALGGAMSGLLYGVAPTDARTLAAVVLVIGGVGALSIWLPTRRATRIDPLVALRQ